MVNSNVAKVSFHRRLYLSGRSLLYMEIKIFGCYGEVAMHHPIKDPLKNLGNSLSELLGFSS
jgi:hypothetical protein